MKKPVADKNLFERLVKAMATGKPLSEKLAPAQKKPKKSKRVRPKKIAKR